MDYPALSPELREKLRRLAFRVRGRGYATVAELNWVLGPLQPTSDVLGDALAYLGTEHSVTIEDDGGIFVAKR
ncbi:hypothetical protein [Chenggangzhangella methanolivorans]|uniref:Uncharacterized protein n=1 Tax=Chenggangzhangella methanolivorans TaxID=1437009 RepID=A0A9E6RC36_9HYPH|nr:hypothetical protein [Chenggangzhangella methanolivorans]QZO01512.1 hypothetical protein K6K41_08830 [Chenggangzhangella methanolivorans]